MFGCQLCNDQILMVPSLKMSGRQLCSVSDLGDPRPKNVRVPTLWCEIFKILSLKMFGCQLCSVSDLEDPPSVSKRSVANYVVFQILMILGLKCLGANSVVWPIVKIFSLEMFRCQLCSVSDLEDPQCQSVRVPTIVCQILMILSMMFGCQLCSVSDLDVLSRNVRVPTL